MGLYGMYLIGMEVPTDEGSDWRVLSSAMEFLYSHQASVLMVTVSLSLSLQRSSHDVLKKRRQPLLIVQWLAPSKPGLLTSQHSSNSIVHTKARF